jgi:phosphoheptose isomerase
MWKTIPRISTREEAERFITEHNIPDVGSEKNVYDGAMSRATLPGLWMEFGVATGRTINYIASKTNGFVYGFDTFEGLPEDFSPVAPEGAFKQDTLPEVARNVVLEVGLFQDTLVPFLMQHYDAAAYVHIDADLYSSTRYVLFTLGEYGRIEAGTVVQFDDFFYFEPPAKTDWYTDEFRAFLEFAEAFEVEYEWIGYGGQRAALRVTNVQGPSTGFTAYKSEVMRVLTKHYEGSLGDVASVIWHAWQKRQPILTCGNGGSAATAIHFASDLRAIGIPAQDLVSPAKITQVANDEGYRSTFSLQASDFENPLVIAFSGSGASDNIVEVCGSCRSILFTSTMMDGIELPMQTLIPMIDGPEIVKLAPANLAIKVKSDNYEVIEDIHLMMCHALKRMLRARMKGT